MAARTYVICKKKDEILSKILSNITVKLYVTQCWESHKREGVGRGEERRVRGVICLFIIFSNFHIRNQLFCSIYLFIHLGRTLLGFKFQYLFHYII